MAIISAENAPANSMTMANTLSIAKVSFFDSFITPSLICQCVDVFADDSATTVDDVPLHFPSDVTTNRALSRDSVLLDMVDITPVQPMRLIGKSCCHLVIMYK